MGAAASPNFSERLHELRQPRTDIFSMAAITVVSHFLFLLLICIEY
jgi:hypothetical protein